MGGQPDPSAGNAWLSSPLIHPHLRGFQGLSNSCEERKLSQNSDP